MEYSLRPFAATDADWLVAVHAAHYTQVEGFDASFAPLVADIVDDYLAQGDVSGQAGWIAHRNGDRLGSIFCVQGGVDMAKLRLFFVTPQARGTGVAQSLLTKCLQFAQDENYNGLTLWTHESHRAAGAIYARNGLTRIAAKPVHSFGCDLVEETWQITF